MGALFDSYVAKAAEALQPTHDEIHQKAREMFAVDAASSESEVVTAQQNLEEVKAKHDALIAEISSLNEATESAPEEPVQG